MTKWRIIGNMTGNSMDAIDVVLTEFAGDKITDICHHTKPYDIAQKKRLNGLRERVVSQRLTAKYLINDQEFLMIHNEYISGVASAINEMCAINKIDKSSINAIGFHGKTLDHNPPSLAKLNGTLPFTTQIGSAQLLADMTDIPVINDFRSTLLMQGFEGAPLAAPHNAHIAQSEGDACYINAGNTSNLAWVKEQKAVMSWDAGPFNEYIDNFVLRYKGETMDKDGTYGKRGIVIPELFTKLFALGRGYYELTPPKSGDPAFYHTTDVFCYIEQNYGNPAHDEQLFCNCLRTFEQFAGYVVAYAVASTPAQIATVPRFVLFGGGWKNPLTYQAFADYLSGALKPLAEHTALFARATQHFANATIKYSEFGTYMEARLFADLARYYLEGKTWELPELPNDCAMVLGSMRFPHQAVVDDYCSQATRGWQNNIIKEK